jgi:hypothetical protein
MEKGTEKYDRLINLLRKSEPVLANGEEIEREVIRNISGKNVSNFIISDAIDFLFGWIYISWVRRTLITASVFLVTLFVWQQSIIIKQISYLRSQPVIVDSEYRSYQTNLEENRLKMFRLYGKRMPLQSVIISKKQMDNLLESVNDLENRYKDLMDIISKDPELKELIEKKFTESNRTKTKL